ncbi:hypothetical protein Nizo2259_1548 [Lactiplantibacillus plantarum]|nr:hypothetical protein LBP_cg1881 [Lactiplantibacillus plantarum subsp. plantarum P-8]ASL80350.1 hypothetical protein GBLP1_g1866 [Lactiplantibacillus plantarum]EMP43520.1 Hypothetical protein H073_11117 [Lactiplantibacillus plantarum UCMA 3037]EPD22909.1 Hypothetical protein L103_15724 [Lactiplantibacillus plantarum IPLA88]KZT88875.1 hypothetical protein Nizo2029_1050 [Lactiplantibacillus plantarum]
MKFHHWALAETPSSRDSIRMADMDAPTFDEFVVAFYKR